MQEEQPTLTANCQLNLDDEQVREVLIEAGWTPPTPKRWEPAETISINMHGIPKNIAASNHIAQLKRYMHILSYIKEHAPDHDITKKGWCVFKEVDWWSTVVVDTDEQDLGAPSMPKEVAEELAEKLNKGEVQF